MKFEQCKSGAIITVHSGGPRGPKGDKGDKGEKGDTGEVTQEEFDQQKDAINLKVAKVEDDLVAHKEEYAKLVDSLFIEEGQPWEVEV